MSDSPYFDVVVVGGGMAGLTAGVRAAELGRTVAVLEAGAVPRYACNTRYSGGVVHIGYQDATLPPATLAQSIRDATEGFAVPELVETVASRAGVTMDWLRQQGAKFIRRTTGRRDGWALAPPRSLATNLAWEGRGPDVFVHTLGGQLRRRGGELLLGARARRLSMAAGRCVGITFERDGTATQLGAGAVVIADGGFQGNADLFRKYIGPRPDLVLQRGAGSGRGDGLLMALEAGAATTRMDRFYGHLLSRDALHNANVWPYPQIDAVAAAAIVVDRDGRRIVDEGLGGIYIANELARLEDPAGATVIADAAIWEKAGREALIPPNPLLEKAGGTVVRAATMGELAAALGIAQDALAATVDAYNDAIARGAPGGLSPARSTTKGDATPIAKAPFIAIPICTGITNTMGGLAIDPACRVLAAGGGTIGGLFAAGAASGGIEGGPHVGYVGGLALASVLGMLAGEGAARDAGAAAPA